MFINKVVNSSRKLGLYVINESPGCNVLDGRNKEAVPKEIVKSMYIASRSVRRGFF